MIHVDKKINDAFIKLNDELATFESQTGSQCTLMFIPHRSDQPLHVSMNGKEVTKVNEGSLENLLELALTKRRSDAARPGMLKMD